MVILRSSQVAQSGREAAPLELPDDALSSDNRWPRRVMSTVDGSQSGISVFFPAFNDARNLRVMVPRTMEVLLSIATDFEVLVIDDGSTDETPAVLSELQRQFPSLRVVRHPRNLGYGAALGSGFRNATKQLVFYTDGDGQYDVSELPALLAKLEGGVGVVNGYKIQRADPAHRRLIGSLYRRLVKFLFHLNLRDVDCDFRLLRRGVLDAVHLTLQSGAVCVELMTQVERAGFRVEEVPVHHYPRLNGRSQFFRPGPVARMLFDVARLWVRLILLKRGPGTPERQAKASVVEGTRARATD